MFINHDTYFILPFQSTACSRIVQTVGLMAAGWNVPMLTPVGTSITNSNKQVYSTLTRVGHINDKFAKLYAALVKHFNYTDVSLLYDRNDYVSDLFAGDIQKALNPVTSSLSVIPIDFKSKLTVIRDALTTAAKTSRGKLHYMDIAVNHLTVALILKAANLVSG